VFEILDAIGGYSGEGEAPSHDDLHRDRLRAHQAPHAGKRAPVSRHRAKRGADKGYSRRLIGESCSLLASRPRLLGSTRQNTNRTHHAAIFVFEQMAVVDKRAHGVGITEIHA
jgi:hypothetical protein